MCKQRYLSRTICQNNIAIVIMLVVMLSGTVLPAAGQSPEQKQPIDMMLVIDNSGSMFPQSKTCPSCEWGNDPDFLRLMGTALFIARLGFAETNPADYQAGVISLGRTPPELISPLHPLPGARDVLAKAISNPVPQPETQIISALQLAYQQLEASPQRRPDNLPAVVLLTDGRPFPEAGQSESDIEGLIKQHTQVPLFVILLENPAKPSEGYERYVAFWEQLQRKYSYVRSFRAHNAGELERTYNQIVALLQNSIPSSGIPLVPNRPLSVYISPYVQRLVLTVTHPTGQPKGKVEIKDANGSSVVDTDPQVERFRGIDNPVEVISIGSARLDQAPRDQNWTIMSDAPVVVFLDRIGAYNIRFVTPEVSLTKVRNQYLALDRQSPLQPLVVRFQLVDRDGKTINVPQPITGRVVHPDGSSTDLRISATLRPDAQGAYEITHDFAGAYPRAAQDGGRFMLLIEAGLADEGSATRTPIARADLLVDVGRGAYIAGAAPEPFVCAKDQPTDLAVTVGDLDAARPSSVQVRVFGVKRDINLSPGANGVFTGSAASLCETVIAETACSKTRDLTFSIRITSLGKDGIPAPVGERVLPVRVNGPICTPTSVPTATATPLPTATPTPLPTPVPDTDKDGVKDPKDDCRTTPQWPIAPWFNGCPPPFWLLVIAGLAFIGLLAFLAIYLIPLIVILISPPPAGYVLVCKGGKPQGAYRSIRGTGIRVRRRTVTIGSQGHIKVVGLAPDELHVAWRGRDAGVSDPKGGFKFTIRQTATQYNVPNSDVILKFSTDPKQLKC